MKIFVDENIPLRTVQSLRDVGPDVEDIRGTPEQGMSDDSLWERVQKEVRLLITTDKGFTQYRSEPHHGILIVRLRQPNNLKIHDRVMLAIVQFKAEEWPGLLIVMRDVVQSITRTTDNKNFYAFIGRAWSISTALKRCMSLSTMNRL